VSHRVPPEAFAYYLGLGSNRSYESVAAHFGVSKTAITGRAVKENWHTRVIEHERKLRESSEQKVLETLEEMTGRHVKIIRAIQGRALEALKTLPIHSASVAVRALIEAVKLENILRGQPSERTAVSVEEVVRREYERWFSPPIGEAQAPGGADENGAEGASDEAGSGDDDREPEEPAEA
jgi:hypothetical protein